MAPRLSRRSFIKVGSAGAASLFLPWVSRVPIAHAAIPGGSLDPGRIPIAI